MSHLGNAVVGGILEDLEFAREAQVARERALDGVRVMDVREPPMSRGGGGGGLKERDDAGDDAEDGGGQWRGIDVILRLR